MISLMRHFYRAAAWAGLIDKNNVLQLAARDGYTRSVKALLQAGANVHALDDAALRIASWKGQTEVVRVLLQNGANKHANNDEAFEWARQQNHSETMTALQECTARDSEGSRLAPHP